MSDPGQLLFRAGGPVATVVWAHDFGERRQTGWFLVPLDDAGEPAHERRRRLDVSPAVERLVADTELSRTAWLGQAETLELVTAAAAIAAGEQLLGARER